MTKWYLGLMLASCLFLAAGSAWAVRWVNNLGWRVESMGGGALGIEDETAAVNLYNHGNGAGVAWLPKVNRSDGGLYYNTEAYSQKSSAAEIKMDASDLELTGPGSEYRGYLCWLDDHFIFRGGVEGLLMNSKTTVTPTGMSGAEEKIMFYGIGGGVSLAYKTDFGLALEGGLSYVGAAGKPDPLDGSFNVYAPLSGSTSKFDLGANNLSWGFTGAYVLDRLGDGNKLSLGLQFQVDDDRPNVAALGDPSSLNPLDFGDYNVTIDSAGSIFGGLADVSNKTTYTVTPYKLAGEAVFNLGNLLEAGVYIDSKTREIREKQEYVGYDLLGPMAPANTDAKTAGESLLGVSPILRAKLPLAEGLALLPGIAFSTWGTGTTDEFSLDVDNTTFKSSSTAHSRGKLSAGIGLQAMSRQLQLAVQYENTTSKDETTLYASDGTAGTPAAVEGAVSAIRGGAEYWIIPVFAVRAGYALITQITKEGALDADGNVVDAKANTGRLTFGLGLSLPTGLVADLMVKLDAYSTMPEPDPKPVHTAAGVFLALREPL